MAHFAELDRDYTVLRVIVVSEKNFQDSEGKEDETLGIEYLRGLFGRDTDWRQTSYNGNIRYRFAGIGMKYDMERDVFIESQPYPSWTLNSEHEWEPPKPQPELTKEQGESRSYYEWEEKSLSWKLITPE